MILVNEYTEALCRGTCKYCKSGRVSRLDVLTYCCHLYLTLCMSHHIVVIIIKRALLPCSLLNDINLCFLLFFLPPDRIV